MKLVVPLGIATSREYDVLRVRSKNSLAVSLREKPPAGVAARSCQRGYIWGAWHMSQAIEMGRIGSDYCHHHSARGLQVINSTQPAAYI